MDERMSNQRMGISVIRYNAKMRINGKRIRNSHYIWNQYNPDDPIIPGDGCVIHHKDENKKNDNPDNLEKLLDFEHRSLHSKHGVKALSKWRRRNPLKAKLMSQKNMKKMLKTLRSNPQRYRRWREKIAESNGGKFVIKIRRRCRCGCGNVTKPGKKYIYTHHLRSIMEVRE